MDNGPARINDLVPNGRGLGNDSRHSNLKANGKKKLSKKKRILLAIATLLVVLGVVAAGWFYYKSTVSAQIDSSEYQAIFFTNGQVYFGKLQNLNGGYYKLNDIFYLQASTTSATSTNPQSTSQSSDVQLIKLGSEVHGPVDEMVINRDQVLFFENLKKDGKVAASIDKYNNSQK
jgi:hypothetical protein